ncbi:MAG: N-acetylglucosamine-6-phosphate deacetylase [Ignavibacteria bacterium]|jgi:N-acetylglucosamine-6-phosphate deacetylase|nr:N-acetylglucosamine-6-phosphate deacetylase [Ignavibacteria bacterium]MCU7502599.1 N-acetylglucosamine-6-phosphate deacetylase [Ignavibacteria bacterium]MCU7515198.1 N-acetylglucosamine-6-phosphate deacetylase [Ignavibacteria bacterium]
MGKLLLKNCLLYDSLIENEYADILIEGKTILQVEKNIRPEEGMEVIDAGGRLTAPGFIDVHIQGAGGADILDGSVESLERMSKTLASLGTTGYLGTTVANPQEGNKHIKVAKQYVNKDMGGATLLGFHFEGPFINFKKKGGLNPSGIYEPSIEKLNEILELTDGTLKMMTIAPELPGSLELIKALVKNNVIASFAHSDASYEDAKKGFAAGINHVTHIFNAMPPINHRSPGPLAAIFENDSLTAQIISDGHHIHPAIVNLVYRIMGPERCICITDGMQAMGLPEGSYLYNGREYESKAGAARYLDGTLIGSTMSLGNIAFKFKEFTGCTLEEAINTITKNPAKLLGIDSKKGSIEAGKDADIAIFDFDKSIFRTLVNGNVVFAK